MCFNEYELSYFYANIKKYGNRKQCEDVSVWFVACAYAVKVSLFIKTWTSHNIRIAFSE